MQSNPAKPVYEFGPFRLDHAEQTLLREGRPVPLPPKVFEILSVLVERNGHLFGKDELMQAVWPDSFVEEGNLTRNISTLRTALGESADDHKYIETVPKRGYRFVAVVREVNGSATVAPVNQGPDVRVTDAANLDRGQNAVTASARVVRGYRVWAIAALATTLFAAFGYGLFFRRGANAPTPASIKQEADTYYWQAKLHAGTQNRDENDKAVELLEKAVAADPKFAQAYALLSKEYHSRAVALKPSEKDLWEAKALEAVDHAISLEPGLAEAHVTRAMMLWSHSKRYSHEQTITELRQALKLNPNLADAHHGLALVYNHIGLLDKGEEEIHKAVSLDPANSGAQFRVGVNLLYQSRYEDALASFQESRQFNPPLWSYQTAYALFQLGRKEEAAVTIAEQFQNGKQDEGGLLTSIEAMLAASAGDTAKAEQKIQRAAELGKGYIHFHHTEYAIASAYAIMNKQTQAMEWLQKAADDGFPCYPLFDHDPNLDHLRQDRHFIAFMMKLKAQWEHYQATL
jgi:DNA-binding winged helix-turn-helix (wHTH) protein/Tfp pilus assembly protein PilF